MSSSLNRMDGIGKVTGGLKFASDMCVPNMLYAVPILSDRVHAKIVSIDTHDAELIPGYVKTYQGKDVPNNRIGFYHDHPVICDDKVRFYGDIVAVVAAESLDAAEQAGRLIHLAYDPLPVIDTPEKALTMECGKVHDQMENNICHQIHYSCGDAEAAFSKCTCITENDYTFPAVDHCFLETECGISAWENGKLVIRSGSQNVFYDRSQIAEGLGLDEEQVVVIAPYTGGAFGGKGDISVQCLIGLVTMDTGRPCKMHFTREQRFINGVKRHPGKIHMKTGTDAEGHILAHVVDVLLDTGAYTVFGNVVLEIACECCVGPYRMENVRLNAYNVYTNNGSNGAFRGFGAAQGCFALEGQINALARAMGMDAIEFRLKNCLNQHERSGIGHVLLADPCMRQTLEAAHEDLLWRRRKELTTMHGNIASGIGIACGMKGYGIGINGAPDYGFAQVAFTRDGQFKLTVGCIEMGQGSFTAMAALLADTLGVTVEEIGFMGLSNSGENEETGATASSRVTYAVGRAVIAAGEELLGALRMVAAEMTDANPEEIRQIDHGFIVKNQIVSFKTLAKRQEKDIVCRARVRTAYSEQPSEGGLGHPHVLYSSNVQIARVSVDLATGMTHVDEVHVVVDTGHCINRTAVEGQSEGGVVMGLSYALLEKIERRNGKPLNTSFSSYVIPTTLDIPETIETRIMEFAEPTGPKGAKGIGENATVPTAPAVVDAINHALNQNIAELPVSPETLMSLIERGSSVDRASEVTFTNGGD
ncbi:MAG: xanthine dehydrogenase family protein molybdopterin-binding subunit [Clostridia bacterium]